MKPERVRKKRNIIFIIAVIIVGVLLINLFWPFISTSTYFDIDELRAAYTEHYENGTFIHTENAFGRYYDFMVRNNEARIICIRSKNTFAGETYKLRSIYIIDFSGLVQGNVKYYSENGKLDFMEEGVIELLTHRSKKDVKWCFMDTTPVEPEEGVDAYPFEHEGKEYVLYIKVENNE